jgi:single-strand DNA-binding protein
MHEPQITLTGHLAGKPRLRLTATGVAVADFRIATTPRRQDRATGEWGDAETLWFGVTVWRALAEHCAGSLGKGDRVVVSGRLTVRSWENDKGERRSGLEVDATSVGLDLSRGRAQYLKDSTLVLTEDAWASSGDVDPETGEVLAAESGDPAAPTTGADGEGDRAAAA